MTKDDGAANSDAVVASWRSSDAASAYFAESNYREGSGATVEPVPTIVVIDRRPLIRECLCRCLAQSSGLHVVALGSIDEWLETTLPASLIVYHSSADPTSEAVKAELARLLARPGAPPVTILAEGEQADRITAVMKQGARAYVPMSSSLAGLLEAIRLVRAGEVYVPRSTGSRRTFREAVDEPHCSSAAVFTNRQVAVIEALRRGKANKIIAHELDMRESTVKVHVRNIMKKLNAKNRTEVAYLANQIIMGAPR